MLPLIQNEFIAVSNHPMFHLSLEIDDLQSLLSQSLQETIEANKDKE